MSSGSADDGHVSPSSVLERQRTSLVARSELLTEFGVIEETQVDMLIARKHKNTSAADFVAEGKLFSIEVAGVTYFPKFQFSPISKTVKPSIAMILAELPQGLKNDRWGLALWWVNPLAALGGKRPVDVVNSNHNLVVAAAVEERKHWEADNPTDQ